MVGVANLLAVVTRPTDAPSSKSIWNSHQLPVTLLLFPSLPSCSVGFLRFSLTSWPLILYYLFKMAAYFHFHRTQRTNSTYSALPDWLLLSLLPTFLPPSYTLACFLFLEICQGNSHIRGLNPHSIPTTLFLITCILVE